MIYENSQMVLHMGGDRRVMYFCHGHKCKGNDYEMYYSWDHVKAKGWRSTKSDEYSPDGEQVMLCPDCVKQIEDKHEIQSKEEDVDTRIPGTG